ncbi:MAG: ABC transporter permease subunit [Acidobacteriota bacterium]
MTTDAVGSPEGPLPRGLRWRGEPTWWLAVGALLAGAWAVWELRLWPQQLIPHGGGWSMVGEFLAAAWRPALDYQAASVPANTPPLLWKAVSAAGTTVVFAAAAMSLALVAGLVLGWAASRGADLEGTLSLRARFAYGSARTLIAAMRSVHELLWAVLFLAAFGLSNLSAVFAIAIPYAGTLAKVFSEMLDEAPRDAGEALRQAGAAPSSVFLFGLLPRALPDMGAYAFYRFECALRSSAVLGFFGYPTLGYFLAASFENLHFREVWTYLYTLLVLIVVVDLWSGVLRRRLVS